jgi:tetratricopeptide (TPR) repeat protein
MRSLLGILTIVLAASTISAADVRDLGVPAGWRASDYDRHGYDLLNKHDYENARRYFDAAMRTDPHLWTAYYNRAITFCQQKKWANGLQDLNSTIRLKRSFLTAILTRATVDIQLGNYNACLRDLDTVANLAFEVGNIQEYCYTLNDRAWLRAVCPDASIRNGQIAVADAKKACELSKWKHAYYIDTLAAACAEVGQFDSAIHYEEQAIRVNESEPNEIAKEIGRGTSKETVEKLAEVMTKMTKSRPGEFSKRLELYKQHPSLS